MLTLSDPVKYFNKIPRIVNRAVFHNFVWPAKIIVGYLERMLMRSNCGHDLEYSQQMEKLDVRTNLTRQPLYKTCKVMVRQSTTLRLHVLQCDVAELDSATVSVVFVRLANLIRNKKLGQFFFRRRRARIAVLLVCFGLRILRYKR